MLSITVHQLQWQIYRDNTYILVYTCSKRVQDKTIGKICDINNQIDMPCERLYMFVNSNLQIHILSL